MARGTGGAVSDDAGPSVRTAVESATALLRGRGERMTGPRRALSSYTHLTLPTKRIV